MISKLLPIKSKQYLVYAVLCIPFVLLSQIYAQELESITVNPDNEKRSSIQTVDAYSYLSENMTLAETRSAAFANAKRQALEMARTYIQSKTKIEDFETKYDLIWATADGAVTVLEQKDHGIEDNTRYHVWIKAEVEYELKPKIQKPEQDHISSPGYLIGKNAPLTVKVWTSQKKYKKGENIEIHIQGNRNFYARIVDITSTGEIIQLLPNEYRMVNYFEAGKIYKIPDTGDFFTLNVSPPYGEDQIVVYASEVPIGNVSLEKTGQGLGLYKGNKEKLAFQSRGITVSPPVQGVNPGAEFYEASWVLTTGE